MNEPLVSVVICVYNGKAFLAEAIESVLKQDYPMIELVVVDDGSSDKSAELAGRYPQAKLISHSENKGLSNARNTGIRETTGEYIAFLDQDDLWVPTKLSTQIDFHRKNSQFKYSYTLERFIYEEFAEQPNWTKKKVFQKDHVAYVPSSMVFQRSLFKRVGLFNPEFHASMTAEWIMRAKDQGYWGGIVKEVLLYRRIHNKNMSSAAQEETKMLLKSLKASINRQKESNE